MRRYFAALTTPEQLEAEQQRFGSVRAFNRLEKHFEFTKVAVTGPLSRLDIEVLSTLVQGRLLSEAQDAAIDELDLSGFSRADCTLATLVECACTVLDADEDGEAAVVGDAVEAAAAAPVPATWLSAAGRAKCLGSLAGSLLNDATAGAESAVTAVELDDAFVQYCTLLGSSPTALHREWKTGRTVMQQLNDLQGQDPDKIFRGIDTRAGIDLYHQVLVDLSKNNTRKVSALRISQEWNGRVEALLLAATTDDERQQIRDDYGFVGEKDVKRHEKRLAMRQGQTAHIAEKATELMDLFSKIKELQTAVGHTMADVGLPSSFAPGAILCPARISHVRI